MLIQLALMWEERDYKFTALVHQLFTRLGLPTGESALPTELPLEIAVLNLDQRPTSGHGGLLSSMLQRLSPGAPRSLWDAAACGNCPVISHCPAHANAVLLSSVAASRFDKLARRAAVERGHRDTPRALWDLVSRVILPPDLYDRFPDPCEASARAHSNNDTEFVLTGLLPITAFTAKGEVGPRIATQAPSFAPTRQAYEKFANAGLLPAEDAAVVRRLLKAVQEAGLEAPALETAAQALEKGFNSANSEQERTWRDLVARTVLGSLCFLDELPDPQEDEETQFFRALEAYEHWQEAKLADNADDPAVLQEVETAVGSMVTELAEGFAALFGARTISGTYLPVHNYDAREQTRAYLRFELSLNQETPPVLDKPSSTNPAGARWVGYRPMAITLSLEKTQDGRSSTELAIDLPSYRILSAAKRGMASSSDAERVYALRRAASALARLAANRSDVFMLVDDPGSGCRYIVEPKLNFSGKQTLSARMVTE
ncbi:hypothetical protein ABZV14_26170 [Streptosporangium canum]|uniref:hypothetical protein n=1 Tax=Streptosporangium canum TaxID=324952 RepID=UPI0033A2B377